MDATCGQVDLTELEGGRAAARRPVQVDGIPCYEVQERAQPARAVLADTFGSGERGRQAAQELLGLVREHPGCFDPAMAGLLEAQLETPGDPETVEATETPTESGAPTG